MDAGEKEKLIAWLDRMRDDASQEWIRSGYDKFHAGARSAFWIAAVAVKEGDYLADRRNLMEELESQFHPDMWAEPSRGGPIARMLRRWFG